ncbi:endonuclease [Lysinibacillus sp. NPDC048646]|uniref:Endonuclease n=1 Tax=Lysinibacillus parviboronicapiens TaxID=436516 RepID=A0ABV2PGS0_9BACI|nr:endonuclease [Lysinibacillus parviboronicapiens]
MNKIKQLVAQLDLVNQLLLTRVSLEDNAHSLQFFMQLKSVSQKVSLAEKNWQVKNACSPISSEK